MHAVPNILCKHPDWESRLVRFVTQEMGKPFVWGERDCTLFALNCIKQMTGDFDHPPLVYANEREALLLQMKLKLSLYDFMRLSMNVMPVTPGFWQRGDILFCRRGHFECCHVVMGETFVSVWPETGVQAARVQDLPNRMQRTLRILS